MKIYSEITKKEYKTVEDCLEAERQFSEKKAKEDKEKELLAQQRKDDAKEIENAYKAIVNANKRYAELRDKFVEKYGSFHMTVRNRGPEIPFDFFNIFNW